MNGKKKYVVIALLLLIGLGSFAFASPAGNDPKKEDNDVEQTITDTDKETEKDEDKDSDEVNPGNDNITNNVVNNVVNNPVDNSYELALAAVLELEELLTTEKADAATKLVEKVTNANQKGTLSARVENAKNAIEAEEFVSELEDMVNNAMSKDNLISALDFRDETAQPAVDAIGGTELEEVIEDLNKRIEDLKEILEDNEAPIIEAETVEKVVVDKGHYNKDVKTTITGATYVYVTKDGSDYTEKASYTENGTYTILAVDNAFNEAELTFTIDKVKPIITGVVDGAYYNTAVTPIIEEENIQNVVVKLNGNKYTSYKVGDSLTKEGTYQMRMSDKAGNKFDYITFVIDTTAATLDEITYTPNTLTNGKVKVTITYLEEIKEVAGWTLTDDKKGIYREFDANETDYVTVYDLAGNETKTDYAVTNIDKVLPTISVDYRNGRTWILGDDNVTTNLRFVIEKDGNLIDDFYGVDRGVGKSFTIEWHAATYGEGEYTVTVYDEAGNSATTTAMVDVTAPTLTITNKDGRTEVRGSDNITTNLRYIVKKDDVLVDDFYGVDRGVGNFFTIQWHASTYGDGEYTVEVIDEVGNSTKTTAMVDTTAPEIILDSNPIYIEKNSTVDSIDLTAKVTDNIDADKTIEPIKIDFISIRNVESLNESNVAGITSSKEGTFKVYYETADNVGNKATKILNVVVQDTRTFELLSKSANTQDNYKTMIGVIVTNKEIKEAPAGWSFSLNNPTVITKKYTRNTDVNGEDVELYDLYGNKLVVNMVITDINELVSAPSVVLKEDTTLEDVISIGANQEKVIDLNGKTLTLDNEKVGANERLFQNSGKLTFKNGTIIQPEDTTLGIIDNNGGEITFDNVKIMDKGSRNSASIRNLGGKVTILNSEITGDAIAGYYTSGSKVNYVYGNAAVYSTGDLVIKNTKIKGDPEGYYAVRIDAGNALLEDVTIDHLRGGMEIYGGNVTLNNVTVTLPTSGRSSYYAIFVNALVDTSVTVNSGTYVGTRSSLYIYNDTTNNLTFNVNGGTFNGYGYKSKPVIQFVKGVSTPTDKFNINIKGGTFKKTTLNTDYIVDGYKQVGDNVVPE